jgi:hypothetical protein
MSQSAYDKLVKIYVDKMYPDKVRAYKREVIRDKTTSINTLMWQNDGTSPRLNWNDAKSYCAKLNLAGFNNWVLPSKDELVALYKSRKKLKNYKASDYWSSTTYAGDTTFAWDVYFGNGYDDVNNKSNSFYLRCVRTGQ